MKNYIIFFFLLGLIAWGFFAPVGWDFKLASFFRLIWKKTLLFFEVPKGESVRSILFRLQEKKLIRKIIPYHWFLRQRNFKTGEYRLSFQQSPFAIFNQLSKGKVITYSVTFPEGLNMFEIAEILDQKNLAQKEEFLKLCQDEDFIQALLGEKRESLEGYLYPNTYQFTKGIPPEKLIRAMTQEFLKIYSRMNPRADLSRHQIVILASIVEKETGASFERKKIAGVFYNRLKKGMRLESDPTILYGILMETGKMPFNIRKKDILRKTAYNTYRIEGFPKGPIANPGKFALQAVLEPENHSLYFFVSRNDGTHVFQKLSPSIKKL